MVDPGFPVGGGANLIGGCQLLMCLRFEKFVCQNEKIGTVMGRSRHAPPPLKKSRHLPDQNPCEGYGSHDWNIMITQMAHALL